MIILDYSKNFAKEYINDLLRIESESFSDFAKTNSMWSESHFLKDLPDKEKLSCLLYNPSKKSLEGFLISSSYGDVTHISRIAVSKEFRGKSYASKMILNFLEKSKNNNFKHSTLATLYLSGNDKILSLYSKFGYRVVTDKNELSDLLRKKDNLEFINTFYPAFRDNKFIMLYKKL